MNDLEPEILTAAQSWNCYGQFRCLTVDGTDGPPAELLEGPRFSDEVFSSTFFPGDPKLSSSSKTPRNCRVRSPKGTFVTRASPAPASSSSSMVTTSGGLEVDGALTFLRVLNRTSSTNTSSSSSPPAPGLGWRLARFDVDGTSAPEMDCAANAAQRKEKKKKKPRA